MPALWVHPLEQPLPVLGVALGFGVVVIALGLLLDALQHSWRGELRHWLLCDAGVLRRVPGIVGAALDVRALWLLPVGIAWALAGAAVASTAGPRGCRRPGGRRDRSSTCCSSA